MLKVLKKILDVYIVDTTNPAIEDAKNIRQWVEDKINEQ